MDSSGMQLKGLHTIHLALRDVQALIDRGPKQTLAKKQLIQKRQADHEAARDRLKQARLLADQKNLQLKTQEARIAEYRAKQNTAASNREYDIIKGQIAADEMSKSVLEDEIFEALEQIDKCQLEIAEREKEVAAAQAELVRYEAEYAAEKPGLEAKKNGTCSATGQRGKLPAGEYYPGLPTTDSGPWCRCPGTCGESFLQRLLSAVDSATFHGTACREAHVLPLLWTTHLSRC